jgi:hypothetical protein
MFLTLNHIKTMKKFIFVDFNHQDTSKLINIPHKT